MAAVKVGTAFKQKHYGTDETDALCKAGAHAYPLGQQEQGCKNTPWAAGCASWAVSNNATLYAGGLWYCAMLHRMQH